jgi:hypothetical protein
MSIAAPPSVAPVAVSTPPAPGSELARPAVATESKTPDSPVLHPLRRPADAAASPPLAPAATGPSVLHPRRRKYRRATVGGLVGGAVIIAAAGFVLFGQAPSASDETIVASPADRGGDNRKEQIAAAVGKIDFQVRPYATVFLDGKLLGQTPFPPVQVDEGKHSVRLVNADLKKEVTVDYVVKSGEDNIFRYTLTRAEK